MPRKKVLRMLNSEDRGASRARGAPGVLSVLFSKIMRTLEVYPETWAYLMRRYVEDPQNGVANNKKEQTSAKGNLSTAFSHDQMTWRVFCKALKFFRTRKATIVIELTMEDGSTHIVTHEMVISHLNMEPFSKEDLSNTIDYVVAQDLGEEGAAEVFDIQYIKDDPSDQGGE